ncbi:hypothetical protein [Halobacillus faecis]|uniref:Uncharacterized protein n=1 Tax=Halobacillus faecis TaxID=360184 RepID=A0A511WST8_9BACI|nr:hypothetical protein [Halobacillus faecis]GEN54230.1 hypothetical protein HFA01_24920 [Halobacillus faecis]
MKIEQDTYYPEMFYMDMNLEIEEIVIPKKILNQAEEMEDMPGIF